MRSPDPLRRRRRRVPRPGPGAARGAARAGALTLQQLIDVPLESLPYVDEHSTDVAATADQLWAALLKTVAASGQSRVGKVVAGRLGCVPSERSGEPGEIGSTIPGFIVTRAVPPAVLALMGEHRFSCYALVFRVTETAAGPVQLSAETRAEFPGARGRVYRALVIGSRGHVLATSSILRSVRKLAERS